MVVVVVSFSFCFGIVFSCLKRAILELGQRLVVELEEGVGLSVDGVDTVWMVERAHGEIRVTSSSSSGSSYIVALQLSRILGGFSDGRGVQVW